MPRSSSSCWFPNTYCRPSPSNLVLTGEAKTAADCQEECGDTQGCEFFTFLRHRGSPQCSLLSSCTRYQRVSGSSVQFSVRAKRCHVADSCVSGGSTSPAYMWISHSIALPFGTHFAKLIFQSRISHLFCLCLLFWILRLNLSEPFPGQTGALLGKAVLLVHQDALATRWTGVHKQGRKGWGTPCGSAMETSILTTLTFLPAPSAPQLVLRGEDLKMSLSFWSQPVWKEASGPAQGLLTLTSRYSECPHMPPPSTTPQTWMTWSAAVRMLVHLTTTQTTRNLLSWCAGEVNLRTLTLPVDGASQLQTDVISSATKVGLFWTWTSHHKPRMAEPVVSVYCDGTSWVGEPKKGIWCYTSPENPGPRDEDLTAPESEISDEETENEGYDGKSIWTFSPCQTHLIVSDCTYVRREACDGNSIMDIELDQEECIDRWWTGIWKFNMNIDTFEWTKHHGYWTQLKMLMLLHNSNLGASRSLTATVLPGSIMERLVFPILFQRFHNFPILRLRPSADWRQGRPPQTGELTSSVQSPWPSAMWPLDYPFVNVNWCSFRDETPWPSAMLLLSFFFPYQLQLSWQWHSSTILSVNCPTVWSMQTFGKVIKSKIETLSTIQFNTKVIIFEVQAMMRTVINWLVGFNTRPPKTETSNIVGSGSQNVHPPLLRPGRQKRRGDCKVLPQLCKQSISKVWSRWIVRILFKWYWKYAQE